MFNALFGIAAGFLMVKTMQKAVLFYHQFWIEEQIYFLCKENDKKGLIALLVSKEHLMSQDQIEKIKNFMQGL